MSVTYGYTVRSGDIVHKHYNVFTLVSYPPHATPGCYLTSAKKSLRAKRGRAARNQRRAHARLKAALLKLEDSVVELPAGYELRILEPEFTAAERGRPLIE